MTHEDIIKKLIGPIRPVGETNTDNERFENLKTMLEFINNLIGHVDEMAYDNKDRHEFSMKRSSDYAYDFFKNKIGIKD